jgi:DNA-binding MarR family transcriptional regulator
MAPRAPKPRKPNGPPNPAGVLARVAAEVNRWVERTVAEHDPPITTAQYLALERLDRGGATAFDLAEGASVSRSAVSQLVASLEAAGFVDRVYGVDRRRQELRLSATGRRALGSVRRLLERRLGPALSGLPRHEADRLGRSLLAVDAHLSGTAPPKRPPPPKPPPPRR